MDEYSRQKVLAKNTRPNNISMPLSPLSKGLNQLSQHIGNKCIYKQQKTALTFLSTDIHVNNGESYPYGEISEEKVGNSV